MMKVPEGFFLSTACAGFRYKGREDLLFIRSEIPAIVKGVFTKSVVKAVPVKIAQEFLLKKDTFQGILVNSGQANACTGNKGFDVCLRCMELVGSRFGIQRDDILPASTGVIGEIPDITLLERALDELYRNRYQKDPVKAAKAIMTTDTFPKLFCKEIEKKEGKCSLLGFAKGAGMIFPNMATMLCFILTDACIKPDHLSAVLRECVDSSFNLISVDGDTSTNDSVFVMANGKSNVVLDEDELRENLLKCCKKLAYLIVKDGEGATKVIKIKVTGAKSFEDAKNIAASIANSPLVKTAFFGKDPNWGRIVAAMGKSGVCFDVNRIAIFIGDVVVWKKGYVVEHIDELTMPVMKSSDIELRVDMNMGDFECEFLTCDLTHEYIDINAEYRT